MSISPAIPAIESLTLIVTQVIHVKASLEITFAALLEQIGPENETPEQKMPMKLEPWPGGRWFRDLGNDNGHFWGHVQAIKRPTLLEITGPLFMSDAVLSNLQYRLTEENGVTRLRFVHRAIGQIPHDTRVEQGWEHMLGRIRAKVGLAAEKHSR